MGFHGVTGIDFYLSNGKMTLKHEWERTLKEAVYTRNEITVWRVVF
jgi:hypothetical protein